MKMIRKSLAMLLCIVMCLSFFPVSSAWAEEPTEGETAVEKKEETPPHEHAYTAEVTAPTCTEQGYTTYTCECGDSYVADYVEPQHQPIDVPEVPATTESSGTESGKKCSVCGEVLEGCTEIPKLEATTEEPQEEPEETSTHEHSYTATVTAPTCTEQGYTTYTCECGDSYVDNYVDATGHMVEDVAEVPATTESEGSTAGKKCSICGEILEGCVDIPKLENIGLQTKATTKSALNDTKGNVIASGKCGTDLTWELDDEGVLIISGTGDMVKYNYAYLPGGDIAPWLRGNRVVTHVIIESGVTSIGEYAFYNCKSLVGVSLPENLAIRGYAFFGCSNLQSIIIPEGVTIDSYAFSNCTNLISISLPNSLNVINGYMFSGCTSLSSINIPEGVTEIWYSAFSDCKSLTSIIIPGNVTLIARGAFSGCTNLISISLPGSLKSIDSNAFSDCKSLTSITIPEGVTNIWNNVFSGCTALNSITIPDSLETIQQDSFSGCPNVSDVYYGGTYEKWNSMFGNMFSSATIHFPEHVGAHSPGEVVIENEVATTCSTEGSYDEVVRCKKCGEELSRETKMIEKLAHTPGEAVHTDVIFATCEIGGSYDEVVCCSVCSEELSRNTILTEALGHDWDEGIVIKEATPSDSGEMLYTCKRDASHTKTETIEFGNDSGTWGNLTWRLELDGTLTISGTGNMPDIEAGWLKYITDIQKVVIEPGITSIGNNVFDSYSNLANITIPTSVTSIGESAFYNCSSLQSVTIPESVTIIGASAFSDCTNLTNVEIPNSVTSIGESAFYNCSSLQNVTIPESVTIIGESAFSQCTKLTSVAIPNSVTTIGTYAFEGCINLTNVTLPEGLTTIEYATFYHCRKLANIIIPQNVTSIGARAFEDCSGLKTIRFLGGPPNIYAYTYSGSFRNVVATAYYPLEQGWTSEYLNNYGGRLTWQSYYLSASGVCGDQLTWEYDGEGKLTIAGNGDMWDFIEDDAPWYKYASFIKEAVVEPGATSIGATAFAGCSIESVQIPNTVVKIGEGAFFNCTSLLEVTIPNSVRSLGKSVFSSCSSLRTVNLSDKITAIEDGAFLNCSALSSIIIPQGVVRIGEYAFSKCYSLSTLTIPGSVQEFGKGVFFSSSLSTVVLEEGIPSLPEGMFTECGRLSSIVIPTSVKQIGDSAFGGCTSLRELVIPGPVQCIGDYICSGCSSLKKVIVAEGAASVGTQSFANCSSLTEISIPSSVKSIGDYAFTKCSSLSSITIPNGVTSIGEDTFSNCTSLSSIVIPANVSSIGEYAFMNCSGLISATVNGKMEVLPEGIFAGCSTLKTVTLPGSIKTIGNLAFIHCEELTQVGLKEGLSSIGEGAFSYCYKLESILLPGSVTSIGDVAFGACSSLLSIIFPARVSTIGSSAFNQCPKLEVVRFEGRHPNIDSSAFTSVTAHAYYPEGYGWMPEDLRSYGGNLTWSSYKLDPVVEYVKRCYNLLLGREGDESGVTYWANQLKSKKQGGAAIVSSFVKSNEFKSFNLSNEETVKVIYRTMMTREADSAGLAYWKAFLDDGASPQYIVNGFSKSGEFKGLCSSYGINAGSITLTEYRDKNINVTRFVSRNYRYALERKGDADGINYWCERIINKTNTPQQCAQNFVFSKECVNRNLSNEEFVKMLYRLYMGREADAGGMSYWLGEMSKGMTRQKVANSFANSREFKGIVAGYGL